VLFLAALRSSVSPGPLDTIIGGKESWLRSRFKTLVGDTLVQYGEFTRPRGVVEAPLRASYASHVFEETSDLELTSWRMRVKDLETLKHHVQELNSQQFAAPQTPEARARILLLARTAHVVIPQSILSLCSGVSP
jgi:hypothetical protein